MQIREIKPFPVICHSVVTDLSGLSALAGPVAKELYSEAVKHELEIAGPVFWSYFGFNGDPASKFRLEIALPLMVGKKVKTSFELKETAPFTCISTVHEGNWYEIPKAYEALHAQLAAGGRQATGDSRELYIHSNIYRQEVNVTEIQLGIR